MGLGRMFRVAVETARRNALRRAYMNIDLAERIDLQGNVLDMGRSLSRSATYRRYLPPADDPNVNYIAVDLIAKQRPDVRADFEATLPFADGSIDRVMLLNVLEHIYEHRRLLSELRRVLKPGGKMYFYVPFFIVIHRHPHDFYRYTDEALERMFDEAGFSKAEIIAHGGFFHTIGTFWDWLCRAPIPFRWLSFFTTLNTALWDGLIEACAGSKVRERFVLGYFVEATA